MKHQKNILFLLNFGQICLMLINGYWNKKMDEKSFYPYEDGECGGSTVIIYVFKATKKGTFQLKVDDDKIIKVIAI